MEVKYGAVPPESPPVEAHRMAVAQMIQPYIEAGCNHVLALDYGALVSSGDLGQAAAGGRRLSECYQELRRLNRQATLAVPA
jgi:hypothetical protein